IVFLRFRMLDLVGGVLQCEPPSDDGPSVLGTWLETARPGLLRRGGAKRLLMVAPPCTDADALSRSVFEATQENCSLVRDDNMDVVACYEVQQLTHDRVIAHLTGCRPRYAELAARMHTRVDVAWTPLVATEA
ncbi:MAG: hypothetical protein ACC645_12175, partial [Pirellulales bacterium]